MKRISPGVYDDGRGGLHIDARELLREHGWPDTPENRRTLIEAASEAWGQPVELSDDELRDDDDD
jgi:hypothetical protein